MTVSTHQVFREEYPFFSYQDKIAGGNVEAIEEADLVFIFDRHKDPAHEEFFAGVIANYADKSVDIALVEESSELLGESLYEKLQERSPRKAIALSAMQIFGWDHAERELWLNKHKDEIRKIQHAAEILSGEKQGGAHEKIQALALLAACHNAIEPESKIDPRKHVDGILKSVQDEQNSLVTRLQEAGSVVIVMKQRELVVRTFNIRQDCLEASIQKAASLLKARGAESTSRKKLFIDLGTHHASLTGNPFIEKVQPFLERIGSHFKYILLNPEKGVLK
ncbi:hypothetical protein [Estrella lausannensis]|uniref:Uncharacterized protein n=1 Tax=Estrella lausannensis TaxID=483423 RepID=A0A0H5E7V5_9BACT|nr:hypothetical protein [Estrella lausannensis]CRX39415.1 hypothetical protein ELAC_2094 [Estrella lausannensis]